MSRQSTSTKPQISTQTLILLCVGWAIFSLLFFLLFSASPPGAERPLWYLRGIYLLEMGAFLGAALLCFRNWRSHQIVSGRGVWLAIGLGMLSFFLGDAIFGTWEVIWGQDPAVSPADLFFILTYIFLGWGMLQAVLPRRLHLDLTQWGIIGGVGLAGVVIAFFVNYYAAQEDAQALGEFPPKIEQVNFVSTESIAQAPAPPNATDDSSGEVLNQAIPPAEEENSSSAPDWVIKLDAQLEPLEGIVTFLYVIGDCILITIAATLLVAFWGGRFSESWKLIAIAAFCLYIADMIFAFIANNPNIEYEGGGVWEVFWTFSGVFFALGAAVEYGISTRSRRSLRRKRG
ncbi:MAG: hypothetical protein QNJ46_11220 [Leptolyngbyaceae cyanobacterium MO_188.B28]|nr:hypothetical protein [Leptolyngbyaceae cyanobacterium MO_188.B28]